MSSKKRKANKKKNDDMQKKKQQHVKPQAEESKQENLTKKAPMSATKEEEKKKFPSNSSQKLDESATVEAKRKKKKGKRKGMSEKKKEQWIFVAIALATLLLFAAVCVGFFYIYRSDWFNAARDWLFAPSIGMEAHLSLGDDTFAWYIEIMPDNGWMALWILGWIPVVIVGVIGFILDVIWTIFRFFGVIVLQILLMIVGVIYCIVGYGLLLAIAGGACTGIWLGRPKASVALKVILCVLMGSLAIVTYALVFFL